MMPHDTPDNAQPGIVGSVPSAAPPTVATRDVPSPKRFFWTLLGSLVIPAWNSFQRVVLDSHWLVRTAVLLLMGAAWLGWYEKQYVIANVSIVTHVPAAWESEKQLHVSAAWAPQVQDAIRVSFGKLNGIISRKDDAYDFNHNGWTIGQVTVATSGLLTLDGANLAAAFESKKSIACSCWSEFKKDQYPHLNTTAWVGLGLSHVGRAFGQEDLDSFLASQNSAGWWPAYVDAWPSKSARSPYASAQKQNASTYTTALAVLALSDMVSAGALDGTADVKGRVQTAIQSAASWLLATKTPPHARWKDYPYASADAVEPLGLAGITLHALHRAGTVPSDVDREWLEELPSDGLEVERLDASAQPLTLTQDGDFVRDSIRHLRRPWAIIATVDAYAQGSLLERASALNWIDGLAKHFVSDATSISPDAPWTSAEFMMAMRYLVGATINGRSVI